MSGKSEETLHGEPPEATVPTTALTQLFRYAQVGHCVSSVTHDVNNLLGAVMAYAELVQMDPQIGDESRRMLGEVIEGARRCSALVNGLTSIARKERPDVTLAEPAAVVAQVLDLRRYDLRVERITLTEDYDSGLPSLVIDKPKFELALLHVLTHAIETVRDLETREIRVGVHAKPDGLEVVIGRSGPAVPEPERENMFEPFAVTNGPLRLGLGLAIARETAQLHDGTLRYDPERGFVFDLPQMNQLSKRLPETC